MDVENIANQDVSSPFSDGLPIASAADWASKILDGTSEFVSPHVCSTKSTAFVLNIAGVNSDGLLTVEVVILQQHNEGVKVARILITQVRQRKNFTLVGPTLDGIDISSMLSSLESIDGVIKNLLIVACSRGVFLSHPGDVCARTGGDKHCSLWGLR